MQYKIKSNIELFTHVAHLIDMGRDVILKVKGYSMLPFIVGDSDSVRLKRLDSVRVGDIVLARINNIEYILHRVIKIDNHDITLMGDGNLRGHEYCTIEDIVATAVEIIKPHRRIGTMDKWHRLSANIWLRLLPIRKYLLSLYHKSKSR